MKRSQKIIFILLIFIFVLKPFSIQCHIQGKIPSEVFTALSLKILSYDRSLEKRFKEKLVIGIVYSIEESKKYAYRIKSDIERLGPDFTVRGLSLVTEIIYLEGEKMSQEDINRLMEYKKISVIFVIDENPKNIIKLSKSTKKYKIDSICACNHIEDLKMGIGFAITVKKQKLELAVNIRATKAEGSEYSSQILELCERVENF